jgi:hypothetical protein
MSTRSFLGLLALLALPALTAAQTLDPSTYTLTSAAAEKFVRATQQLVASGSSGPNMQGGGAGLDLAGMKASLDQNPAAQQALSTAGITSADYVLFMGAAMTSMMVGQMEMAGVRGMLPPGVTKRPSQENIDFMKQNMELFSRAMTPGASATNLGNRASTSDEALPIPADAAAVLPSSIFDKIPPFASITAATQCSLDNLDATIKTETEKTNGLATAYYGNPGNAGLARTKAEGDVLERAGDSALFLCGQLTNWMAPPDALAKADADKDRSASEIEAERERSYNACPGIPGGKDPACERTVNATAARKLNDMQVAYLRAAAPALQQISNEMKACTVKRENIVVDAKTADVRGANITEVMQALVLAWQLPPFAVQRFTAACEDAQRYLLKQ